MALLMRNRPDRDSDPACLDQPTHPRIRWANGVDAELRVHMMDVAVAGVAAHAALRHVLRLDGGHLVSGDRALRGPHVEPVEPRGVAGEDLGLDRTVGGA